MEHPCPKSKDWEILIDVARCRYGAAIGTREAEDLLGLVLVRMGGEDPLRSALDLRRLPILVTVQSKKMGMHTILVTEIDEYMLEVINHEGVKVQKVRFDTLDVVDENRLASGHAVAWVVPRWMPGCWRR